MCKGYLNKHYSTLQWSGAFDVFLPEKLLDIHSDRLPTLPTPISLTSSLFPKRYFVCTVHISSPQSDMCPNKGFYPQKDLDRKRRASDRICFKIGSDCQLQKWILLDRMLVMLKV